MFIFRRVASDNVDIGEFDTALERDLKDMTKALMGARDAPNNSRNGMRASSNGIWRH